MAPKQKVSNNPDSWWQDAYANHPYINAEFEFKFGNDVMVPGTKFRIKHKRGEFKFRCVATNTATGVQWIDCIEIGSAFRSFKADQIRNIVKPRVRRKRIKK